jgi:hypothetical protein
MLYRFRLIAFLLMALLLVACQPAPAPTATPVAIATVQPTDTPLPPSSTPVPTEEAAEEPTPVPTEVEEVNEESTAFLTQLGTYATGILEASGAEIVAYDPDSQRIFSTNAANNTLDILNASDPTNLSLILSVSMSEYGAGINSVAVKNGLVAAAIEAEETDGKGQIVFLDTDGLVIAAVEAGVLPDMVTFTPDGSKALSANEGEPNDDYTIDPEGSITIVDLSRGVENLTQDNVTQVTFERFNDAEIDPAIRIFGPNATVAQDLEPEYIAVSSDSSTAYVSLQENNALAVVDIAAAEVTALVALGFKDHSIDGAGLDASDSDGGINIRPWPVLGMVQPDTIAAYAVDGATYVVSANEGDARAYAGFDEETRVADLTLDPDVYPNAEELQAEENLGRLRTTTATGDSDGDGDVEQIYSYGARSFTIWDSAGSLVWDSGDQFEQIVAQRIPDFFNAQGGGDFDSRSDDKGGEPEALTLGVIDGRTYAFVGLERQSAIFVYDITDPQAPSFVDLVTNWNPEGSMEDGSAGDVSPEGMVFIPAEDSPNGQPLLVVANEFSGTVTIWTINP